MKNKYTYISLFSGAGVGCYGFLKEKFDCIATCEIIPRRLEIQKINNKCKNISGYISSDIKLAKTKNQIFSEIQKYYKTDKKDVDVVIATPPCQGMSVANHKKTSTEINRNSLILESIDLVSKIKPKVFIFENVRSFLKSKCITSDGITEDIDSAISKNLLNYYHIHSEVVNFKNLGVSSSRTRTLVIGTRKDVSAFTPIDLFPENKKPQVLKKSIGDLKSLKKMGEIDKDDIYHAFRKYDKKMLVWVANTKEGDTAFNNKKNEHRPHKIINGKIVPNKNTNSDKYRRNFWDNVAPCIHTRNDILASQSTIHPRDNRVFSIRELIRIMSIRSDFKWSQHSFCKLNKLCLKEKETFLKNNDINIRQCIGESVPTIIFQNIAKNIKKKLNKVNLKEKDYLRIIEEKKLNENNRLKIFIQKNLKKFEYFELVNLIELANLNRTNKGGYYTRKDVCFDLFSDLPDLKNKNTISILEPSVGGGAFIPFIIDKYKNHKKVVIDMCDIDANILSFLKIILTKLNIQKNVTLNIIHKDFLLHNFEKKYDLIIGNPPFGNLTKNKETLLKYKSNFKNSQNNNLSSFFLDKSLDLAKNIAFIFPKSFLSAPGYKKIRNSVSNRNVTKISDYGEKAFDVKIETIGIVLSEDYQPSNKIKIVSLINNSVKYLEQQYVCSASHPHWLLYRNDFFDSIAKTLVFNKFSVFRDRQITKKDIVKKGSVKILKPKNIGNGTTNIDRNHDKFVNKINRLKVASFINRTDVILCPNLTYNPRACRLPRNTLVDGSIALLIHKEKEKIKENDLKYFGTDEFKKFYSIARNKGTRSLNIDSNSVFFFGIKK